MFSSNSMTIPTILKCLKDIICSRDIDVMGSIYVYACYFLDLIFLALPYSDNIAL